MRNIPLGGIIMRSPELIVMLTHNDLTVKNAYEVFDSCKHLNVKYWGFKEEGIGYAEMKSLCKHIKASGKTAVLEVVAYTEGKCLEAAAVAVECGFDILMGTLYYDSVKALLDEQGIKYMPFVGRVYGRPSILDGEIEEIIAQAEEIAGKGVYGIDLLGYRYVGDCVKLNRELVKSARIPVCLAGSIDSTERLDEVIAANPFAFTVGSAFFEGKFGSDISEQIQFVIDYINK